MIGPEIRDRAGALRVESLDLLESLVRVNSHSAHPEGINRVGQLVLDSLPASMSVTFAADGNGVRHHVAAGPCGREEKILLVGHLDTVFPYRGTGEPFETGGGRVVGPGTADMKGGVVVMIQALKILDGLGLLDRVPIRCLFNGDEEVGSPFSSRMVRELGKNASCGLVFEAGGLGNQLVTSRRGVIRYDLTCTGKARHAGVKEGPKASAIVEMARLILALEELNDQERGVSINVGTVKGGVANNIVPDQAQARFEFRFRDPDTEREILARFDEIVKSVSTPGCGARMDLLHRRPGMVPTPATDELVTVVLDAAGELGQSVVTQSRGGASDGNFLTEMGVPVIDGLGPVGDLDHSADEYIVEQSLHDRIALTALLLCKLAGIA
ncbi:MAG: M20 family metallopeptidase [bacterium]|nr:M20 family metallopeptidase [bacterium]